MERTIPSVYPYITPPPSPILGEALEDCFTLVSIKMQLEDAMESDEFDANQEYHELVNRLADTESHINEMIAALNDTNRTAAAYRGIKANTGRNSFTAHSDMTASETDATLVRLAHQSGSAHFP